MSSLVLRSCGETTLLLFLIVFYQKRRLCLKPQVLNQSPRLEYRAPSHEKRILNLNKGKLKETETEKGATGPRPLGNLRSPQGGLGWAGQWVRPRPVLCTAPSVCLPVWTTGWATWVLTQAASSVRRGQ